MGAAHFTTTEEYSQWDLFGCPSVEGSCDDMDHLLAWQPIPPEEAWISVKDELPEGSGKYLTRQLDEYDPDGFYYESHYFSRKYGRWNDFDLLPDDGGVDNKINAAVTHWAPLPEEPVLVRPPLSRRLLKPCPPITLPWFRSTRITTTRPT